MKAPMPFAMAWPKVSLTCMKTALRGGDVDDVRHAALLGDLGDRGRLAGVEGANQHVRAFLDQALGAGAGRIDARLGVGVHQLDVDAEHALDHLGREVGAFLARLADEAEIARARQQHADAQLPLSGARDAERGESRSGGYGDVSIERSTVHVSSSAPKVYRPLQIAGQRCAKKSS